jgi:hypothetical protein
VIRLRHNCSRFWFLVMKAAFYHSLREVKRE